MKPEERHNLEHQPTIVFESEISLMEIPTAEHVVGLIAKKFEDAGNAITEITKQLQVTRPNDFMTFGMNNISLKHCSLQLQEEFYQFFFDQPYREKGKVKRDDDGQVIIPSERSQGLKLEGEFRRTAIQTVLDQAFIDGELSVSTSEFFSRCAAASAKRDDAFVQGAKERSHHFFTSPDGLLGGALDSKKSEGEATSKTTLFFKRLVDMAEKFESVKVP